MRYKTPKPTLYNKAQASVHIVVYDFLKRKIINQNIKIENLKQSNETLNYIDNLLKNYTKLNNFIIEISINTGGIKQ